MNHVWNSIARLIPRGFAPSLLLSGTVALLAGADAPKKPEANRVFVPPVRLKADDQFIDSGPQWAHSGPCLHDVDGDGKRDLLVGDFSGLFRLYRNIGRDTEPRFTAAGTLKAGGEDANVPIY